MALESIYRLIVATKVRKSSKKFLTLGVLQGFLPSAVCRRCHSTCCTPNCDKEKLRREKSQVRIKTDIISQKRFEQV
ncbi:MAG: hypothetical protein V7K21_01785 [Nostoc sp.]